jgi:hypothetical protein
MPGGMLLRRIPWARAWVIAVWLVRQGRERLRKNLSAHERQDLIDLMRKSKGRRGNLSKREQQHFISLVRKAATGKSR